MAINTIGITPAGTFLPTVWSTDVSDATQANTGLATLVDRRFEDNLKFGRIITIPDRSNPAVRVKTEDTTGTYSNRTETNQTITISRQAYVAFLVEDITEVQSKYDLRKEYTDAAAYSLMAWIEGDGTSGLASLPSGFTNAVGTLGVDPGDDDFIAAKNYLDQADVPMSDRYWYYSPGMVNAMFKIDKFVRSGDYPDVANISTGMIVGKLYGAKVMQSTLAANNPGVAGQAYGWHSHKRGVALVIQRKPTTNTQHIPLEIGEAVVIDTVYNFATRLIQPKTLGGASSDNKFNVAVKGPS
jgi:hypothetical protein